MPDNTTPLQSARLLTWTPRYTDLMSQLKDGEHLWVEYYCPSWAAPHFLPPSVTPMESEEKFERFRPRFWNRLVVLGYWALTREQEELYLEFARTGLYDPFQRPPIVKPRKVGTHRRPSLQYRFLNRLAGHRS